MFRLLIVFVGFFLPSISFSQTYIPRVDGTWEIVGFKFAPISAMGEKEAKQYVGKKFEIDKGFFSSPFATCKFCGLEKSYKVYPVKDFQTTEPDYKTFEVPGKFVAVNQLKFKTGPVPEVTLVTVSNNKTAYFLWDGVYFILQYR